jgi:predicted dehydrogenase
LYDIGIYCINAARSLFREEPTEVFAFSASNGDKRFSEIDEMTGAVLRFPEDRLATFTSSFGATDLSAYRIVGTKGDLLVDPAYAYSQKLVHRLTIEGKQHKQVFPRRDQFAAQIIYFSQCVLDGNEPEPSGQEGLADVRIIEALYRSAQEGQPMKLEPLAKQQRPSRAQEIDQPPVSQPELVHAESPNS